MEYSVQSAPDRKTYIVTGQITFTDNAKMSEIQKFFSEDKNIKTYIFDLSGVSFIDSAGLGMLLSVRAHTSKHGVEMILRSPQDKVLRVFNACSFEELFEIES